MVGLLDGGAEITVSRAPRGLELRAYRTKEPIEDLGTPERCERFLKAWEAKK